MRTGPNRERASSRRCSRTSKPAASIRSPRRSHRGLDAASARTSLFYFSAITQVTIGFGDLHPDWLAARVLAMTQGLVGTLLLAFAISRFASAVKPLSETPDS